MKDCIYDAHNRGFLKELWQGLKFPKAHTSLFFNPVRAYACCMQDSQSMVSGYIVK